jgi:hypothetical protein
MSKTCENKTTGHNDVSDAVSLSELIQTPSAYECETITENGNGFCLIDAGIKARGGFRAGLLALSALYSGYGYADYGRLEAGGSYVPTVDTYLDHSVEASRSFFYTDGRGVRGADKTIGLRLIRASDDPAGSFNLAMRHEIVFSPGSFLHHVLRAAGVLVYVVRDLVLNEKGFSEDSVLWAWGKAPFVLRQKDENALRSYQDEALYAGAVSAVWLRAEDNALRSFAADWNGPGEIRLHNVQSGNTFIGGLFDSERLWQLYTENE